MLERWLVSDELAGIAYREFAAGALALQGKMLDV